jgi:hypothetical protein
LPRLPFQKNKLADEKIRLSIVAQRRQQSQTLRVAARLGWGSPVHSLAFTMYTIEIRTYRLKPEASSQFELAMKRALPMVRASMNVVAFGRTDHEGESYFLIRAFSSEADLKLKQEAFYSSLAWRNGPREPLVECIDTYVNTIVQMSEQSVNELRSQDGKGLNAS